MYHIMYAPKQNRHPLLFYLMIYKYKPKPSPGETSLKPGGKTEIWGFVGAVHLDMVPWSSSESRQMLWTVLFFFYGKHMKHGSIIHFLGRVCKLPSSHFTMDPSCQRYTGRQSSQEGSGSQCSANEPEVRLFHGRCVWFLCGRVHVFFSWKPVFQSLMLGRWRCLWKFLFNSIIDSGMLRSDYNSLQGDWHE